MCQCVREIQEVSAPACLAKHKALLWMHQGRAQQPCKPLCCSPWESPMSRESLGGSLRTSPWCPSCDKAPSLSSPSMIPSLEGESLDVLSMTAAFCLGCAVLPASPGCSSGAAGLLLLPEGLDEPLHLLCLPLHTDVGLELPQGFVQLHAREIHLVHHTAGRGGQPSSEHPPVADTRQVPPPCYRGQVPKGNPMGEALRQQGGFLHPACNGQDFTQVIPAFYSW